MVSRISIAEAKDGLDLLFERARAGEEFVVEREGVDVCRIAPPERRPMTGKDFVALLRSLPRPDSAFFDEVERVANGQSPAPPSPWE